MTAEMNDGSCFREVQFKADTAADVTTITESLYYDRFGDLPLTRPASVIRSFDNREIGIKGTFESEIRIYGRVQQDRINVVSDDKSCILGMNFLSPLDVIIDTKMQKVMDGVVTRKACERIRTVTEKPVKPLWSSTGILKVLRVSPRSCRGSTSPARISATTRRTPTATASPSG